MLIHDPGHSAGKAPRIAEMMQIGQTYQTAQTAYDEVRTFSQWILTHPSTAKVQ
jgi:hypothetical protein